MLTLSRNLTTAIHFKDNKAVRKLLKLLKQKSLSRNPFIFGGYRLLKLAIGLRRKDIAKLLIKKGARVNPKYTKTLCSPLHHAVGQNYFDIIKLLIKKGANINQNVVRYSSPLFFAVSQKTSVIKLSGRLEIMKCLLKNGADTEVEFERNCNFKGLTALYTATENSNIEQAKLLLKYNANVYAKHTYTDTYMTAEVILCNEIKVMSLLLNYGAKPNFIINKNFIERRVNADSYFGRRLESLGNPTLLHFAIITNEVEMVDLLIQYGADIHFRTKILNRTPLMLAVEEYNPKIVEILLKSGARVDDYDGVGISPLHYIICNPNNQDKLYSKKILFDLDYEKWYIYELLLKAGANINEALKPLGSKLTFISAAATYGQYLLLERSVLNSDLDCSLIDYSILKKAKLDIGLLPPEIVDDPDNLSRVKNAYRLSEIQLLRGIIKSHFKSMLKSDFKGENRELLAAIESTSVNDFKSRDEHIKDIKNMIHYVKIIIFWMMKHKVGDTNISLWSLFISPWDTLINQAFNQDVRKLCSEDFEKYIPYRYELKNRIDYAVKRSRLLENSVEIAFVLFKSLPLHCCRKILSFLSNHQLKTFNDQFNDII